MIEMELKHNNIALEKSLNALKILEQLCDESD